MSYSARQSRYLSAMGIQRWVLREPPSQPEAAVGNAPMPPPTPEASTSPSPLGERGWGEGGNPREEEMPTTRDPANITTLDWEALQQRVADCQQCSELAASRSQTVFGVGNRQAEWMLIGEAPGDEEERLGEPFVGPAGQLLNAMLAAVGLGRQQVYIANVLKCRPPNNRDPHVDEAAHCLPFLHRQIALVQPKLILLVGRVAAQQLLGSDANVGELRGQVHRYQDNIPMIVTYHPAYLLRKPTEKRKSWQDLCLARAQLEQV